jgi:hypothetical protein
MGVRWYELEGIASGQTPGVVQSGTFFEPSDSNTPDQRSYWMGTIMVSGQGHAAMGFSVAGANEYINAATVGRLAGDPLGTMRTPILYSTSTTPYNPPSDPGGTEGRRWGDYSFTSLDPTDDMTMWTIQQFCDSVNSYGVRVAKLLAPPPATPSSCTPSSVAAGTDNLVVAIAGLSVDGSGYFDPGAGFPSRLSVNVDGGGVTVNSLTYTDPTHLTMNISLAATASVGARPITVFNPDGQAATSVGGILSIVNGSTSNRPPVLATIPDRTTSEETLLTFSASATDPDGDALTYALEPGAPTGASINPASGLFMWTPSEVQGPATNVINVRVVDNGTPPLTDTKSFAVIVNEVNTAPLVVTPTGRTIDELTTLVVTNMATDADLPTNALTFSLDAGFPAGATIDSTSGVFTWRPNEAQGPGVYDIAVRVTDDGEPPLADARTFTVTVNDVNSPPLLAAIPDQTVHAGSELVIAASATDTDIPTNVLTFGLEPGAPGGAGIDPANGVFTWTPGEADVGGTNLVSVRVTDNGLPSLSEVKSFAIVVVSRPVIQSITIADQSLTITWSATPGRKYRIQFKAGLDEPVWTELDPEVTAVADTAAQVDDTGGDQQRFYRVLALP